MAKIPMALVLPLLSIVVGVGVLSTAIDVEVRRVDMTASFFSSFSIRDSSDAT